MCNEHLEHVLCLLKGMRRWHAITEKDADSGRLVMWLADAAAQVQYGRMFYQLYCQRLERLQLMHKDLRWRKAKAHSHCCSGVKGSSVPSII